MAEAFIVLIKCRERTVDVSQSGTKTDEFHISSLMLTSEIGCTYGFESFVIDKEGSSMGFLGGLDSWHPPRRWLVLIMLSEINAELIEGCVGERVDFVSNLMSALEECT